jgi:hypothetical protein
MVGARRARLKVRDASSTTIRIIQCAFSVRRVSRQNVAKPKGGQPRARLSPTTVRGDTEQRPIRSIETRFLNMFQQASLNDGHQKKHETGAVSLSTRSSTGRYLVRLLGLLHLFLNLGLRHLGRHLVVHVVRRAVAERATTIRETTGCGDAGRTVRQCARARWAKPVSGWAKVRGWEVHEEREGSNIPRCVTHPWVSPSCAAVPPTDKARRG